MNMMVNTSELVASEAETKRNSETALKSAISKLVASWEKKQAIRAKKIGGFGLLAVSLAACNSSSDDTTTTTTTTTTPTTDTTTPAAPTVNNVTVTAAGTQVFGTAGTNDVISATGTTLTGSHLIVDSDTTDSDSLSVALTGDYALQPTVVGIEDVNFNFTGTLSGGDQVLNLAVHNITASGDTINIDVVSTDSLVNAVTLTGAGTNHYSTSDDFGTVTVGTVDDADIVLTVNNTDSNVTTQTGAEDDLTINGGTLNDVTLAASTATEDLVVTGKDITITAAALLGNITLTAANDVTNVTAAAAKGDVNITAGNDITAMTVTAAAGTVNLNAKGAITVTDATAAKTLVINNTGGVAGTDNIIITDAQSATSVTVTSIGTLTATANQLAAATSITATVGSGTSAINSNGVASQTININADSSGETNTPAAQVNLNASGATTTLNLGGVTQLNVTVDGAHLTAQTVTNTNSSANGATLTFGTIGADIDATKIANNVTMIVGANANGRTITTADGQTYGLDAEVAQTGTATFDHTTDASGTTSNAMTIALVDSDTSNTADTTSNAAAIVVNDVDNLTIAASTLSATWTEDLTGDDLDTVTLTGGGTGAVFDMNADTIIGNTTGGTTPNVTFNAADYTGVVKLQLDGGTGAVESITTGSGADEIRIAAGSASGNAFTVNTGGGADKIDFDAGADATIDGGSGIDSIIISANQSLSGKTVNLTSVEVITLTGGGTNTVDASWINGKTYIIEEDGSGTANFTITMDQVAVDLSNLAFRTSFATGTDFLTINGSSIGLAQTVTGSAADDKITGGAAADTINGGEAADTIDGGNGVDNITLNGETTVAADILLLSTTSVGGTNYDKVTGFDFGGTATDDNVKLNGHTLVNDSGTAVAIGTGATVKLADANDDDATILAVTNQIAANTFDDFMAGTITEAAMEAAAITAMGDTGTNLSNTGNEKVALVLDDGEHTGVFIFAAADATDNAVAAAEIGLSAILIGVTDHSSLVAADFLIA